MSSIIEVATQPYQDQKPGTSGLRKKVSVFQQPNYTENFIQAILEANSKPKFLVVGGDGRYYSQEAIEKIINVCAANRVERLMVAKDGILSTPSASALIRSSKADGGIILTASHNPGGPEGDFGIKYNISNGGPAPEQVTDRIYSISKSLSSYNSLLKRPKVDLSKPNTFDVGPCTKVQVIDPIENYLELMREVFDFDAIKALIQRKQPKPFRMLVDPMNGVLGPYAKRILVEELGAPETCLVNAQPKVDFGGKHPDPNLTHADELVRALENDPSYHLGVAFDGDGDRNMILGAGAFFVSPGDSLAVIGANLNHIKYFKTKECKGFARSLPTSPAIDRVAAKLDVKCYETPTGWKYFGNLMDSDLIALCGEESFGTGSNHIREKDGLWACLAWLSIMSSTGRSVEQLVRDHWKTYGRDYFTRYDFEECDAAKCQAMMKELEQMLTASSLVGKNVSEEQSNPRYKVKEAGNFEYTDPVDKSVTSKQGLYIKFSDGARIIWRLSGTGSSGATVRLYVSDYATENIDESSQSYLKDLVDVGYKISKLTKYTGRTTPTVIT